MGTLKCNVIDKTEARKIEQKRCREEEGKAAVLRSNKTITTVSSCLSAVVYLQ